MDNFFEPRKIMTILLRWWWVLALVTLLVVAIGYVVTQNQTPVYEATTTVMVGDSIQYSQINRDEIAAQDTYTQVYAEIARRQPVLEGAVNALGLDLSWRRLRDSVSVHIVDNTTLIEITVSANSPQTAEALAGEIANQMMLLNRSSADELANHQFIQQEIENLRTRIDAGRKRLATLKAQVTFVVSSERLAELKTEIDTLERFVTDWEDTYSRLLTLSASNTSQNSLILIEEAHANSRPVSPILTLNMLLSMCIGLVFSVGIIFLLDRFDNRIRSSEELEQKLGMNYLGTISKMKGKSSDDKLIGLHNPQFGTAIYYKMILDKLGFSVEGGHPVKSLLVTVNEGELLVSSSSTISSGGYHL